MSLVELLDLSTFMQLERLRLEECCAVKRLTCSRPMVALRKIELIRCDHGVQRIKCNFTGFESVGTANAGPSNLSLAMETSGWLIIYTFNATRDLVLDSTACNNQVSALCRRQRSGMQYNALGLAVDSVCALNSVCRTRSC